MMLEVQPAPFPDLPQLPRPPSLHAVLTTPVDRTGACRFLPCSRGLPRLTGGSGDFDTLCCGTDPDLIERQSSRLSGACALHSEWIGHTGKTVHYSGPKISDQAIS